MHIPSKVCDAQRYRSSESVPGLSQIIINGDSVISFQDQREDSLRKPVNLILNRDSIMLNSGWLPREILNTSSFLRDLTKSGLPGIKAVRRNIQTCRPEIILSESRYRASCMGEREIIPLTFRVRQVWFLTLPAKLIYLIFFILLILAIYASLRLRFARKLAILEKIINKKNEDLMAEKEKTEKLLANLLPKNAADEIMAKGKATKVKYNFVTVLFSDIQGFTRIAEETNPEVLIDELDKFFFYFDSVVEKYGIEKIKTIGDAYMCAGGIPEKNRTNPVEVILAALDMKSYMSRLKLGL